MAACSRSQSSYEGVSTLCGGFFLLKEKKDKMSTKKKHNETIGKTRGKHDGTTAPKNDNRSTIIDSQKYRV